MKVEKSIFPPLMLSYTVIPP